MALAYTPGLKIKELTVVKKIRKLPIEGEINVQKGDRTEYNTIVARAEIPGNVHVAPAAQLLQIDPIDIHAFMKKKEGEKVTEGEIIASRSSFFGLSKASCKSPTDGKIEFISDMSGQVTIRCENIPITIDSYIPGIVTDIFPKTGVEITTLAALIQGIYGIGSETHGGLTVISSSPDQLITDQDIPSDCKGKIIVGGSSVSIEALRKITDTGAFGFISGGIDSEDLFAYTGGKMGFGVTGFEEVKVTIIITEGFGRRSISDKAYNILKKFNGSEVSINGETQIRAGVVRPEIIIPRPDLNIQDVEEDTSDLMSKGMELGMMVRSIRAPYFGEIGFVSNMNSGLELIETGSSVRVLEMELRDGRRVTVPRANVEIIE